MRIRFAKGREEAANTDRAADKILLESLSKQLTEARDEIERLKRIVALYEDDNKL